MLRCLREAIAIGAVRAIEVGVVMAYEARLDANPCPGTGIMCCAGDQQLLTAVGSGSGWYERRLTGSWRVSAARGIW